jgi:hypothetical protein
MITLVIGSIYSFHRLGRCWSLFVSSYRFWHKIKTLMMQLKSLYHEPNWRFRFTNWNIHYRIAFLHFRLCHFKTAITGATDLDMYWISAAAFCCESAAQIPLYTYWLPDAVLLLFQH